MARDKLLSLIQNRVLLTAFAAFLAVIWHPNMGPFLLSKMLSQVCVWISLPWAPRLNICLPVVLSFKVYLTGLGGRG